MASERAGTVSFVMLSIACGILEATVVLILVGEILIGINGKTPPLTPNTAIGLWIFIVCRRVFKAMAELVKGSLTHGD